ncbi:MAG: hypothetical protein MZV49_24465 [Rhodopseudomonas palustris]|nr:hypothetical protein [Rhodopseudomonas palustris]
MPAREFDLRGVAGLITSARGGDGYDLPFVVQGPWDDPLVFPDPESLIRRSPASWRRCSTPVKDRKTRDAVRSVLELLHRLQGRAWPPSAPGRRSPRRPRGRNQLIKTN